ncbi:uncharacterized protein TRIADDRAFT_18195 [Trichoplax adhaerens]|uniref:PNPLA domain-containing protein n=1 Tax=Trichoplax adhaerens TaxID=10228 RepID=B3RJ99_TRIAD|nr:hypothetical protein TRIADDRAFT_18195 [Trichoplax adhaerens]EDV29293.1 hypothetical protein TRIADDRAFT_18195 [Trichoplax adhaerens]|eukprot:XP_002108495.1 hypothetical protein TRIADDRAFT_18195 [Trichoplax adhaerens]
MNLAFSGGGFLSVYQLGVAAGFVEYAPDIIKNLNSASGASGGAITASALVVCPDKLPELSRYCIEMGVKTRDFYTGAFHPRVSIPHLIEEALDRVFPDNAHQLANNKVHISLTRARDRQNILISEFFSKMDLIKCVACSCFVPFWSGIVPPFYRGERYLDGGISDNHPIPFDIQKTITISPFVGDGMICPNHVSLHDFENSDICIRRTIKFTLGDLHRATRALFSPDEASLRALCQQGFEDALEYLRKHHCKG